MQLAQLARPDQVLDWVRQTTFARTEYGRSVLQYLQKVKTFYWDDAVKTAAIEKTAVGTVIRVAPGFYRQHLQSTANLAFVLLHEASHSWRSDFSRFVPGLNLSWRSIANFTSDLFVNAALFRNGFPLREDLTVRLYEPDGLEFFLLPPHQLLKKFYKGSSAEKELNEYCPDYSPQSRPAADSQFYRLKSWLYERAAGDINWLRPSESKQGFERLFEAYLDSWFGCLTLDELAHIFDQLLASLPRCFLLGSHGVRGIKGRGDGPTSEAMTRKRRQKRIAEFVNMLRHALVDSTISSRPVRTQNPRPGVIPAASRRSCFLLSRGIWPVFFMNEVDEFSPSEQATHVYLDSSGSMSDEIIDFVSGLLLGSGGVVAEPIYLFASQVKPVSLKQLQSGYRLSGGTMINEVLTHAREKKLKRFVVITDGGVEDINSANKNYLETADMFVIFENRGRDRLTAPAQKSWENLKSYIKDGTTGFSYY